MARIFRSACRYLILALVLASITGIAFFPTDCMTAAKNGVTLCIEIVIPSLFPFFVLSAMCIDLGVAARLERLLGGIMRPIFGVCGASAAALAMGLVGGYPVGVRTAVGLYNRGLCTKNEAAHIMSFCNNSGPGFILGAVGAGVFSSALAGILLYACHIGSSLIVGVIMRRRLKNSGDRPEARQAHSSQRIGLAKSFTASVTSSFSATLNVCAFVIFFTVIIKLLAVTGVMAFISGAVSVLTCHIGLTSEWTYRILTGFVEISSGVWTLSGAGITPLSLAAASLMLGWGGISVHCQVSAIAGDAGIPTYPHTIGKVLHAVISSIAAFILAHLVQGTEAIAAVPPSIDATVPASYPAVANAEPFSALCLLFAVICVVYVLVFICKKNKRHERPKSFQRLSDKNTN